MKRPRSLAVLMFAVASLAIPVTAQDTGAYTQQELRRHFDTTAKAYQIRVDGDLLRLREQPLMNWKNPVRTHSQGAMYVWEKDGRPHVLGSIFTYEWKTVRCRHELISISPSPLTAELYGDVVWSPKGPGLQWRDYDQSVVPAESASRRLFQMRSIARRFSGTLTDQQGKQERLTLKPQPLLRYADSKAGVVDGAVFALAMGTDPEILLVVEATSENSGRFRYAAARANYMNLKLELANQLVWSAPAEIELQNTRAGQKPWADEPFFPMTPLQPLPLPEELR